MQIAQLILFLITNLPSIIKAIREIIDIFDGDTREAKEAIKEAPGLFKDAVEAGDMSRIRKFAEERKKRRENRR